MDTRPDVLFVSPHLDDAVLSCAGAISRLTAHGAGVLVASVFTADPASGVELSALARRNHAAWGLGDAPFAARRAEDVAALTALGAAAEHLGFPDAVYRMDAASRPLYQDVIGVPAHSADRVELVPAIAEAVGGLAEANRLTWVFVPAGVGGHVDHALVRTAVEQACENTRLVYYEEYPYSQRAAGTARPDAIGDELTEIIAELSPDELDARIEAIACYRSQLRGLFPSAVERVSEVLSARAAVLGTAVAGTPDEARSRARMAERVRRAVAERGGERYWWLDVGQGPPLPE